MSHSIIFIAHNIRSTHNVGSLLRTADGLGIDEIYFTGYTPYPALDSDDPRLPHISQKLDKQINKTALGASKSVTWYQHDDVEKVMHQLRSREYQIAALEQASNSILLPRYQCPQKLAVLLGSEVEGITSDLLNVVDVTLEIPMVGQKESFNVTEAATMVMYHCTLVKPYL